MFLRYQNLKRFIPAGLFLRKYFKIQQAFTPTLLNSHLADFQANNDSTLQKKDWRRMRDYPWQFNVFFADIFALLRQNPLAEVEREKITLYASSLCLYDDFFDNQELSEEEILNIYLNPQNFQPKNDKEKAFLRLLNRLYSLYQPTEKFKEIFQLFYQGQCESKEQLYNQDLSRGKLQKISFNKGGYALVLSRLLMDNGLKINELQTVYELGAWYQILDDIVDIATDRKDQINTLATTVQDIGVLKKELENQQNKAFQMIRALDYPPKAKEQVVFLFFLIGTSGWVHLRQLEKAQAKTEGKFKLETYEESDIKWLENHWANYPIGLRFLLGKKF